MKELVNVQINDALAKRKEQLKQKKDIASDGSGSHSHKKKL